MKASTIRCLITAGPTREFFDPVRFISNPSSGKMGFALAAAAVNAGWTVDLVSGPVSLPEPDDVLLYPVVTGDEMLHQVDALFDPCDILIKTAAVCDYRPAKKETHKLKKSRENLTVELEPVTDILKTVAARKRPDQLVVGFAAETRDVEAYARRKLEEKNLDFIVANQVGVRGSGFESDSNSVILIGRDGTRETFGPAAKTEIARALIERLSGALARKRGG